jgi:hypothetical protein
MSYDKDIRKRRRVYEFSQRELSYEGMTLWQFCQAIMQLPEDARIYNIASSWSSDSIEMSVGSKDFDEVENGATSSFWIYDNNKRTFIKKK